MESQLIYKALSNWHIEHSNFKVSRVLYVFSLPQKTVSALLFYAVVLLRLLSLEVCSVKRMKVTHVENRELPFLHSTRAERCLHLCLIPCGGQFVCKVGQNGSATQDQAQLCRMIPSSPELLSWSRAASGCLLWKQTNTSTVSAYSLVKNCVWAWCLCCSYHHLLSTEGLRELKACFLPWWM